MNAKTFLRQLKKVECIVTNKLIEKEQWENIAAGIGQQMGGERVQTSSNPGKMADAIAKYIDMDAEIVECAERLKATKRDVSGVIEQLNETEYDLLHKVYVQHNRLETVAEMYDKTYSWATTVHGRALRNVQKILDERKEKEWTE